MSPFHHKIELSPRLKLSVGRGYSHNRKLKIAAIFLFTLAIGLTVNAARLMFFTGNTNNASEQNSQPQILGATDTKSPEIQFEEYAVQKNDTLFSISQKFNISWTTLASLNNLKSPFIVKPGQKIKIPKE